MLQWFMYVIRKPTNLYSFRAGNDRLLITFINITNVQVKFEMQSTYRWLRAKVRVRVRLSTKTISKRSKLKLPDGHYILWLWLWESICVLLFTLGLPLQSHHIKYNFDCFGRPFQWAPTNRSQLDDKTG